MNSVNTEISEEKIEAAGQWRRRAKPPRAALSAAAAPLGRAAGWIPLAVFPAVALWVRPHLAAWVFMWAMAVALFAGFKWLTWWQARRSGRAGNPRRQLAYLLLWPGMDAATFLDRQDRPRPPGSSAWAAAAGKTAIGALLLFGLATRLPAAHDLLAAWTGMVGLILVLHFGTFHLIALYWQRAGIQAQPLMDSPLWAVTLGDFWGNRWNTGFRQLTHRLLFGPLRKHAGTASAGMAPFLASGLIHESVISLPAQAGYGLPTAYFLLQGAALTLQRSSFGRRLGLASGWRGRAFTLGVVAGPAYWLFHPDFVARVMLPFLRAIGAR